MSFHTFVSHQRSKLKATHSADNLRWSLIGLGDFLTAIEKGLVKAGDTLLIESLDRASELLRNILRSGVDVVTLSDGEHYTSESL